MVSNAFDLEQKVGATNEFIHGSWLLIGEELPKENQGDLSLYEKNKQCNLVNIAEMCWMAGYGCGCPWEPSQQALGA